MKSKVMFSVMIFVLILAFSNVLADVPQMINYQGKITTPQGALVDTTVQMVFKIYDAATDGGVLWADTHSAVVVEKGVFSVLLGSVNPIPDTVFLGDVRYLGIKVGADPEMTPRKEIVSVAYAYRSFQSDTANYAKAAPSVPDNDWTFRITDTADTTLMTGGAWGIARYGNTLYGNADSTHVNLGVACTTGTSGQNYKYCTVGGGYRNMAEDEYTTVGGGWYNTASNNSATVGGGGRNAAAGNYPTIGGGYHNTTSGNYPTIGGGYYNIASGSGATVAGGGLNTASGYTSTVGGGDGNTASGRMSTVSGGAGNTASDSFATVGGGVYNTASGDNATIPGGYADTVAGDYSFAAGKDVKVNSSADYTFAFGYNFTTSTAHAVIFYDSDTETKVGIQTTSPTARLDVSGSTGYNQVRMRTSYTPTGTSDANGNTGDIAWDDSYFYVKTSAGWKRAALSTW